MSQKKNKGIEVYSSKDNKVFYHPDSELFTYGEAEFKSLYEAKKYIEDKLRTKFTGSYIVSCYDGICEFEAKSKHYDSYKDEWYIRGLEKGKYNNKESEIQKEENLYPVNDFNLSLLKESRRPTKKVIEPLFDKVQKYLSLQDWNFEIRYMSGSFEGGENTAMSIDINIPYLGAVINIWDKAYTLPEDEVKHAFIHEMCHVYTESLYSIARANANPHLHVFIEEQREQLTERIARLIKI